MIYAAIVASGTGKRMGADIPKQFLPIGGKPIIVRTFERFLNVLDIDLIYAAVSGDWIEKTKDMCAEFGLDTKRIRLIEGGSSRTDSVYKLLCQIEQENGVADGDVVLTHDGVRPFVSEWGIIQSIEAMKHMDGVTLCCESTDTILYSENGEVIDKVPNRSKLFRAQTPQTFKLKTLLDAYRSLDDEQKSHLTDTASIFTSVGLPVGLIRGSDRNIKITTPFDMKLAQIMAQDYEDEI